MQPTIYAAMEREQDSSSTIKSISYARFQCSVALFLAPNINEFLIM
jgi:hypothetical protein